MQFPRSVQGAVPAAEQGLRRAPRRWIHLKHKDRPADSAATPENLSLRRTAKRRQLRRAKFAANEYSKRSSCIRWKYPCFSQGIREANRGRGRTAKRESRQI